MTEASQSGLSVKFTRAVYPHRGDRQGFFSNLIEAGSILWTIFRREYKTASSDGIDRNVPRPMLLWADIESGLVDFLVELESCQLDRPFSEKGSVHCIDRQFDRVDMRQIQFTFRFE